MTYCDLGGVMRRMTKRIRVYQALKFHGCILVLTGIVRGFVWTGTIHGYD